MIFERGLLFIALLTAGSSARAQDVMTVDACVRYAIEHSPEVEEADAKVAEWQARLAEVEAIWYPKLFGMAFVAPMFTVEGSALEPDVVRRFESISDWGPYTKLNAVLAQPLYTFGRAEAGEKAADNRRLVEVARARETRNSVALEVRKMFYTHLYTKSIMPALKQADEALAEASEAAEEMYEKGEGDVTQPDLMKIAYGGVLVARFKRRAEDGATMSLAALKHTMGWPADRELKLPKKLPKLPKQEDPSLAVVLQQASEHRPEWDQIRHGKAAALSLADAEILANAPVLALAGQFEASWTPTRDDTPNPYHYDPYNDVFGGIALVLQFNIDPWNTFAKRDQALAIAAQIDALKRFAKSGIPLQTKKAHSDLLQRRHLTELSGDGVKATRKWLAFAAAAFQTGTGEAKELLTGLAAYVESKNHYYEHLQHYHTARAELLYATGRALPVD